MALSDQYWDPKGGETVAEDLGPDDRLFGAYDGVPSPARQAITRTVIDCMLNGKDIAETLQPRVGELSRQLLVEAGIDTDEFRESYYVARPDRRPPSSS